MTAASLNLDRADLAQQYEQISIERQYKTGQRLIQDLALRQSETVLDIGCGTGLLAEYIVGLVGSAGSVIGIDPLPLRIEIAKQRTRSNLNFRIGNVYDLSAFSSDSFDVVSMNAVFHWFADKPEALRQTIRVLKKGGRLGISTGAKGNPNPLHSVSARVLSRAPYNKYAAASERVIHRVSTSELKTLLTEAGFQVSQLDSRLTPRPPLTPEAALQFSEASSFGNFLGHLPPELRRQARQDIKRELESAGELANTVGERFQIVAIAVKP